MPNIVTTADGRRIGNSCTSGGQKRNKLDQARIKKRLKEIQAKTYKEQTADEREFVQRHSN